MVLGEVSLLSCGMLVVITFESDVVSCALFVECVVFELSSDEVSCALIVEFVVSDECSVSLCAMS